MIALFNFPLVVVVFGVVLGVVVVVGVVVGVQNHQNSPFLFIEKRKKDTIKIVIKQISEILFLIVYKNIGLYS